MLARLDALGRREDAPLRHRSVATLRAAEADAPTMRVRALRHHDDEGRLLFDDLDLELERGELVALVGANGAGKSTLLEILAGLLEARSGSVRSGGWAPDRMSADERVARVVLAPQQVEIFDRSVAENIAFGRPDATRDEIETAARRAGAEPFIRRLPGGYDEAIGPRGARLSGGERQRIALARALCVEPALLLLDESLSMVEPGGERRFLERNAEWLRERTTLIVTHRHESFRVCDRILRLEDGRISEELPNAGGSASKVLRWVRPSPPPR